MLEKSDSYSNTKIDVSLLQTFHLVAKTGSFSGAARRLNISYQSAANHVRRLEQMYGMQLVEAEKGSREIALTGPGRALHASLGNELETMLARISLLMRDVHSVMRVGVPQALFHHFFPEIVSQFLTMYGDTELSFFERDTALETMMLNGELDTCICERYFGEPGISQVLLGEYPLALVYPAEWPTVENTPTGLRVLRDRPYITYEPGQTIRARAQAFLTSAFGQPPNIVTSTSGCTSIMEMVNSQIGFAIVPDWMARKKQYRIKKFILDDFQKIKVYFGCSAFLEHNEIISEFKETCRVVMSVDFSSAAASEI